MALSRLISEDKLNENSQKVFAESASVVPFRLKVTTTSSAPKQTITVSSTSTTIPVTTLTSSAAQRQNVSVNWDAIAECESGGDWSINTGNGYYGGLQFSLQTWQGVGGTGYPHEHSREEQIHRAEILYSSRGLSPWPVCGKQGYS